MKEQLIKLYKNKYLYPVTLFMGFLVMCVFIYLNEDHEGGEDNISLYMLARFCWQHPDALFASPIKIFYTILISVPAQLGFKAVQIATALASVASVHFAVKLARKCGVQESWLLACFILFTPVYFNMSLTVLSEIWFALFLMGGLLLVAQSRFASGLLLLSFLPFIRSEGFVLLGPVLVYLLCIRRFKYIPFLLAGTLVFMGIGYPFHHDVLWIFHKNYGDASQIYGHGEMFSFVKGTLSYHGRPMTILLGLAVLFMGIQLRKFIRTELLLVLLVFGCFFGFWALHDVLWWKGWGASLGLTRVMAAVAPLGGILCVWVLQETRRYMYGFHIPVWLAVVFLHVYSCFKYSDLPRKMDPMHALSKQLYERNKDAVAHVPEFRFTGFYFGFLSGRDIYSAHTGNCWTINEQALQRMPQGSLVQYETQFGPNECGIPTDYFDKRSDFEKIDEVLPEVPFQVLNGYDYKTCIYRKK